MMTRPAAGEYLHYYEKYIDQVPDSGPAAALEAQRPAIEALRTLTDAQANHRYAEGKWSVKEVLGHLADAERVFAYRLLRIARADRTPLSGFDENAWAVAAPYAHRTMDDVVSEMLAVRAGTIALVGSLDAAALARATECNGAPISGRALCWILAGHTAHHMAILHERYGV